MQLLPSSYPCSFSLLYNANETPCRLLPSFVYGYGIAYGLIFKEVLTGEEDRCTRYVTAPD
jgi:hypothetical protein